ncbi:hypothetical protein OIDMADRAFT_20014, partial [Oidiodendron maius Zn]
MGCVGSSYLVPSGEVYALTFSRTLCKALRGSLLSQRSKGLFFIPYAEILLYHRLRRFGIRQL